FLPQTMQAARCPTDDLSLTNCAVVNEKDFESGHKGIPNQGSKLAKEKPDRLYTSPFKNLAFISYKTERTSRKIRIPQSSNRQLFRICEATN
ncbi:UNVERIFIED_CONTAM: hypothetical protein FKN15_038445, partial [Acipenser sinensis]